MRAGRAAIVLGAVALPGVVVAATEAPSTAHLSWVRATGAETCVDAAALAREVSRRLGRDAFGGAPSRSIEGVVARAGSGWVAHLYVRDLDGALLGERTLTSDAADCASLGSAVTLAVALAIDPEAALAPPPAASSAPVAPVASPSSAPAPSASASAARSVVAPTVVLVPAPAPAPAPAAAPPPAIVELRGGVAAGLAPQVGPAFSLAISGRGRAHPRLGALFVPAQRTSDGVAAIGLVAASLGGCAALAEDDAVALDLCAALLVGAVHASAFGVPALPPAERAWVGVDTGVDARLRLVGPLLLSAGVAAVWPITRHDFRLEGRDGDVFRQPFVGMVATAGLGVRF